MTRRLRLLVTPPGHPPMTWEGVGTDLPLIIGRAPGPRGLAVEDPGLDPAHALIEFGDDGRVVVEDLGGIEGTWLNGSRVVRCTLRPGDRLRLAGTGVALAPDREPPARDPLLGRTLGGYDLEEVIGRGGYGTVYRALQHTLGRLVAVKVLSAECAREPGRVEAFLAEARRAGRLTHPNLVRIHDVLAAEGHHLLVMELLAGTVLGVRGPGPLAEPVLLTVLRDVCRALAYAESQGLVHRDVKPENILVDEAGVHKLADLGLAAPLAEDGVARPEGVPLGSAHYAAPEQTAGAAIDGRADLYALGATAWRLATGATLYQGDRRTLAAQHRSALVPDLRRAAPGLSERTARFVTGLLAKDPAGRPAGPAAALRAVEALLAPPRPVRPRRLHR